MEISCCCGFRFLSCFFWLIMLCMFTVIWVFRKYFTEFARILHKIYILYFQKIIQTCHLLCKRPRCYHSASKTQVAERIFKLSPVHALVIYLIPWICWIHWISDPLRETPLPALDECRLKSLWNAKILQQWWPFFFKLIYSMIFKTLPERFIL